MPGAHRRDRLSGAGHDPSDPPDRRDQLGDGVLGGDRVGQDGGIHRAFAAATEDTGLRDDLPHRLVDPVRPRRFRQPLTPVHQCGRVESVVVQRHSGSDLPPQVTAGRVCGFPVGQVMQGLQHQDRGHHRRRDRRPSQPRPEQVLELLIAEHILAMCGKEREHAALRHQMTDQCLRVQQFPIRPLHTLHGPILPVQSDIPKRRADYSAPS